MSDCHSREPLLSLNSDDLNEIMKNENLDPIFKEVLKNPDKFNDEYCRYEGKKIDKWAIYGEVISVHPSAGALVEIATQYLKNKAFEWSKICKEPKTTTRIHSRPYLCRLYEQDNIEVKGFIVMFSFCNSSAGYCCLKSKLLNGVLINESLTFPLQCKLEVTVGGKPNSTVASAIIKFKKVNTFADESLLLDIRYCDQRDFPLMIVKVSKP